MYTEKELNKSDEAMRREFAKLMTEKLREKGMSRYQLAKEVSVKYLTIRNIEACKDCHRSTMARIAKVLDINIVMI